MDPLFVQFLKTKEFFHRDYNKLPTVLYIGYETLDKLKLGVESKFLFRQTSDSKNTFNGLEVIVVDRPEYLKVGI